MMAAATPAQAPARQVLAVAGLRKVFPGVVALDGVDFDVRAGEVHALLGANGAGKSTLIKTVAGLYRPDGGEIRLDGRPVEMKDTQTALRLGVSVIYQDFALIPHLSVAENLFLGQEKTGALGLIDWRRTEAEAARLLDLVGATFPASTRVSDLGTGQRQLVEIAKALRSEAKLLILDEPTASLSQGETDRLLELVRRLARSGVGIVYVSHRLEEIMPLVDRVTVLRDGRSVGTFPASQLDRHKVVSLITGHERAATARAARTRAAGATLLDVRGLTRPREFEDVSLSVRAGEIVVLTGLVGAGRTELLQTLFGARRAQRGEILLGGRPVRVRTPQDAIAAGIALIPEDRRGQGVSVVLPVAANITLATLDRFTRGLGLSLRREAAHARRLIGDLRIKTASPQSRAGTLSGGNQQKVVLAKWLSTQAEVFLFDEPTQGVDVGAKDEIYALIERLAAEGKGILIASSDLEEVMTIADRILALRGGRIVREFDNQNLRSSAVVDAITHG